jgi:tRNA 2-thiouridine synthesizing protein E
MSVTINPEVLEGIAFDEEGFLVDPNDWTPAVGETIAAILEIELTPRHWDVIQFARREYAEKGEAPTLRRITKVGGVPTKELYQLFPGGPAKIAAKIAGLHKPTGCI